jgi:predicted AAA+ superfamily ATPase
MIQRLITNKLLQALSDTPVVLLTGARQSGKSTLVRLMAENDHPARYLTLDDAAILGAATTNPQGFIDGLEGPVVLDEIQRAPGLFLAIKAAVDRKRTAGRFLMTGSANVLVLPRIADSLAGRIEVLPLWPFSQSEIEGTTDSVIDMFFAVKFQPQTNVKDKRETLLMRVLAGGYPEAYQRTDPERRSAWFGSYITTILQRDIRELANIDGLTALPKLLSLLAARSGSLLNFAELSNSSAIPQTTLKRYMSLFETTYLLHLLPAWSTNLGKRVIKTPKVYLTDSGLTTHLLGMNMKQLESNTAMFGHLFEGFVLMELMKQSGWSKTKPGLYHFRTHAAQEVDFVLEAPDGSIIGIEVKTSAAIDADTFSGLRTLAEHAGKKFMRGIVLYSGREVVSFGKNMIAAPIEVLWSTKG